MNYVLYAFNLDTNYFISISFSHSHCKLHTFFLLHLPACMCKFNFLFCYLQTWKFCRKTSKYLWVGVWHLCFASFSASLPYFCILKTFSFIFCICYHFASIYVFASFSASFQLFISLFASSKLNILFSASFKLLNFLS